MTARWLGGAGILGIALGLGAPAKSIRSQQPTPATDRCDSIVARARADSVQVGLFVVAFRSDGLELATSARDALILTVVNGFTAPRPFRLSVFTGPARSRILRPLSADSTAELRAPTLTGVYRFSVSARRTPANPVVVRASLMPGFDSSAMAAIRSAMESQLVAPPPGEDSMRVDFRFSTDSTPGARRIVSGIFPRMPVVNAIPRRDNPAPEFPDDEKGDSTTTGEVVLRFVVDRTGAPAMETVELVRGTSVSFLRAALVALPKQMFTPATIHGCPVAQRVEYPFTFTVERRP